MTRPAKGIGYYVVVVTTIALLGLILGFWIIARGDTLLDYQERSKTTYRSRPK